MIARRTLLGFPAIAAAGGPGRTIGVGMLGASHSHAAEKLRLLRESSEWRLIGVAEEDPRIVEELRRQSVPVLRREELLAQPEVEVIAVESGVPDHARDACDALRAGKHLHLEKVPAMTLREFEEVVRLARQQRRLVQVGYMWRYHPGFRKVMEAARAGWLGQVYLVKGHIGNQLVPERRPEWARYRGGVMFELGSHLIDAAVRLLGPLRRVDSFLRRDGSFEDTLADNTCAVLEWDRAMGVITASTLEVNAWRHRAFAVYGTNGCAVLNPLEPPALRLELERPAGPYAAGMHNVPLPAYRRYWDDFRELAAAVRGEARLSVSLDEEWEVQRAVLAASRMLE